MDIGALRLVIEVLMWTEGLEYRGSQVDRGAVRVVIVSFRWM